MHSRETMEQETQEKIFEAARKVFYQRGFFGARMQEIADEAQINKSMLHYYFRNKDQLFKEVFKDSFGRIFPRIRQVLASEMPLFQKIEVFVNRYIDLLIENPFMPSFVFHEMSNNQDHLEGVVKSLEIKIPEIMERQVEDAIAQGLILPVTTIDLTVNMLALCVFPFIARPMIMNVFPMEDNQYKEFLKMRKKEVSTFIINGIRKK